MPRSITDPGRLPSCRPRWDGVLREPPCPDDAERRRVRRSGEIKWNAASYINQALAGSRR